MTDAAILRVRLTPKGGHDALITWDNGTLSVRVAAPPVDGIANRALIALLSDVLGVLKSRITFQSGETARTKTLKIEAMNAETLQARLAQSLQPKS